MECNKFIFTLVYLILFSSTWTFVKAKFKICAVDGRAGYQKINQHCPDLNVPESPVECVPGVDRFDCLRKIRKEKADFAVFTPEDLVAVTNTYNDILITTEMRTGEKDHFEEELVAIVSKSSGIQNTYDLKGKILCHPGFMNDGIISTVLSNYLERAVVREQSCDQSLPVPENRIKSTSDFFKSACRPGFWVNDRQIDNDLKIKYKNLCEACGNPSICSNEDQYFGTSGSLLCLMDGAGDIAWTTLNKVRLQFGLNSNNTNKENINEYLYLCPDDTTRPLTSAPCVWVAKPWAIVGARRSSASAVQKIIANITHDSGKWQNALVNLLEVGLFHVEFQTLETVEPVDSYLSKIPGFLSANSFTGCHPPRTVRICTTSIISKYKCDWMREAAEVRGVAPEIDCIKADNVTHCMKAIQMDAADVVMVDPDFVRIGIEKYGLSTLLYETVKDVDKIKIVAVVNPKSDIKSFNQLRGKKVCFPMYNGIAWNSVLHKLQNKMTKCPYEEGMKEYFGESCVPGFPDPSGNLTKLCKEKYKGDRGALNCLIEENADVAFVSTKSLHLYINESKNLKMSDFRIICDEQPCHLSWSAVGEAMVYENLTTWRRKDIVDVFLELDMLFGVNYKESTRVYTMYGPFNGEKDVLFHDDTKELRKIPSLKNYDPMPRRYDDIIREIKPCQLRSNGNGLILNLSLYFITLFLLLR